MKYICVFLLLLMGIQLYVRALFNPKQLETHGCIFSTVATDGVVLKHPAICTLPEWADWQLVDNIFKGILKIF